MKDGNLKVPVSGKVYGKAERACGRAAVDEGVLTGGRWGAGFELHLKRYLDVKEVILCNSGSSANLLALSALTSSKLEGRLRPGDAVITSAVGFPTTVAPIYQLGLVPIYMDIDSTLNVNPELLEDTLKFKPRAMILAHTLGNPFNLYKIVRFCDEHRILLIEDCCDALGAGWGRKKVGTFGLFGTLSFYPAHHITTGEGGAIFTNDPKLARIIRSFRDWGRACWCRPGVDNTCKRRFQWKLGDLPPGFDHKYIYNELGYNMKMTEMQAAIGFAQMSQIHDFVKRRQRNFAYLYDRLKELEKFFIFVQQYPGAAPSWFGFPLTVRRNAPFMRSQVIKYLERRGIATRMLFAGKMRAQPAFKKPREYYEVGTMISTDVVMTSAFWVGCWHGLRKQHLDHIISALHNFVKEF